jgi:hypothetical protein
MVVAVLVLRRPAEGAKTDHASMSSKMSATSRGSGVRGGARGTVILSDLRTEGIVVVWGGGGSGQVGSGSWRMRRREVVRRRGKVGSSCGLGPGSEGRGLLIRLREAVLVELREGGGRSESGRALVARDEVGKHGEARETTWPSSRAYHDTSSSSSPSSGSKHGARVNSNTFAGLASGTSGVGVITRGWIITRRGEGTLRSFGLRSRPGQSSSDVRGVVGMSMLEQADMLVSEGVGERERRGDSCRRSRGRVGRGGVVIVLQLDSARGGESLTGEVGATMSMTMSKALRRTDWCLCLAGAASRVAVRRKSRSSANSALP